LGFLRSVNSTDPDNNAWAKLERNDVTPEQFSELFAEESEKLGHRIRGADLLGLLHGPVRQSMRATLELLPQLGFHIACLTNNVQASEPLRAEIASAMLLFERVYESSKIGSRKPEVAFYSAVLADLGIEPAEAVFLDDLGVNLKPARQMGMTTIKVTSERQALRDLASVLDAPSIAASLGA
jgi:putative hydrolase of the HAD superfamily